MRIGYIAGWMRSGTTLLSEVLGSLPGAVAVGELSGVWREAASGGPCSCGENLDRCALWGPALQAVSDEHGVRRSDYASVAQLTALVLRTRNAQVLAGLGHRAPSEWPDEVRRYVDITTTMLREIRRQTGAEVLIDSSKLPPGYLTASLVPGADVRVIHIVRDPRAVAHSELKTRHREGSDTDRLPPGRSVMMSAYYWTGFNLAVRRYANAASVYTRIRYEDFAARPHEASAQLARYLGLPASPGGHDGNVMQLAASHLAVGNPSRFASRKRVIAPDLSWQELSPHNRWLVTGLTAPARPLLRPTLQVHPVASY